jgi:hypothetical protein
MLKVRQPPTNNTINGFDKGADGASGLAQIAIAAFVNLLLLQSFHEAFGLGVLKSSQLHPIRSKKRNRSESLTFSTLCTGKSSRWWTRAALGGKTVFISAMPQAG